MILQNKFKSASCGNIVCTCMKSVLFWICSLLSCIAVAIVISALFTAILNNDSQDVTVPSNKPGRTNVLLWRFPTGEGGLQVEVLNALDDNWTPFFDEYIRKWDAGYQNNTNTVDPLSLSAQRVEVDPGCQPVAGKVKACNADYGETDWRGINIALTDQNNYIQNSISKYNDYWLTVPDAQNDDNQMKYTMCHELGHGWGLAHTDEDYYNTPTGECMDYTEFPQDNLDCGQFNFDLLYQLYGNSERRVLRTPMRQTRILSDEILQEYHAAVDQASRDGTCSDCVLELSQGYTVVVHKLLV